MPKHRPHVKHWPVAGIGLALVMAMFLIWLAVRSPLSALPRSDRITLKTVRILPHPPNRVWRMVTLDGGTVGETRFILSTPHPLPENRRMPLVVVLGGLPTAKENLQNLPSELGDNVVLVYEWPLKLYQPENPWQLLPRLPEYYRKISRIPGQVDTAAYWTSRRPMVDPEKVSLLGFSLGALTVPSAHRIMQTQGLKPYCTVLAYGGTPLGDVLIANPAFEGNPFPALWAGLFNLLTRHIDPGRHLPHLEGRFLVIYGREDRLVPLPAAKRLARLTPEPKTVLLLEGGHMGVRAEQLALLSRISRITLDWLVEQDAMQPVQTAIAR